MKTAIEQLRRGASFDLKLHKQPMTALIVTIFILYLISIVTGEKPRTVYYYSEMGMFPVVIMFTLLLFQREIGGGSMELVSTYPASLRLIAVRKWVLQRRGIIASAALRAPAPRLTRETIAEIEWLLARVEQKVAALGAA